MFGSNVLEIAIGITFIFLLISLICTAIREGIESFVKSRGAFLERGIRELLKDNDGTGIAKSFYNHPLIYGLFTGDYKPGKGGSPGIFSFGHNMPSYIPSRNFALALMDIAARGPETDLVSADPNSPVISLQSIRMNIGNIHNVAVQRLLLGAIDTAQGDLNKMQASIEEWYNSGMDRVSGWYKRSTQFILFYVGLIAAIGLNINTITIIDYLSKNGTARAFLVQQATSAAKDSNALKLNYTIADSSLNSLNLPIGWNKASLAHRQDLQKKNFWNSLADPVLGWMLTALAVSIGAPFWFDTLNKIMVVRSTVKPHEKSQEEASQKRQTPKQPAVNKTGTNLPPTSLAVENTMPLTLGQPPNPADAETAFDGCATIDTALTGDISLPVSTGGLTN